MIDSEWNLVVKRAKKLIMSFERFHINKINDILVVSLLSFFFLFRLQMSEFLVVFDGHFSASSSLFLLAWALINP
jgi:hypothetical protein